jgi:hypothetical protein
MRWTLRALPFILLLAFSWMLLAQGPPIPRLSTVDPGNGKAGDVLVTTGANLGKESIAELYLTDGKNDIKVEMTEQAAESIKFKIPAAAKTGRYSLMVLTRGDNARLIEQPVRVSVE